MTRITTKRLIIEPMTDDELRMLVEFYESAVPELSRAYNEMLESCALHPQNRLWYTSWRIFYPKLNKTVGYAGFKGINSSGSVEIGYGTEDGFEGNGFATEAVRGLCEWAFSSNCVEYIEAETEADNFASQRVLAKIGFASANKTGDEGPVFILNKDDFILQNADEGLNHTLRNDRREIS